MLCVSIIACNLLSNFGSLANSIDSLSDSHNEVSEQLEESLQSENAQNDEIESDDIENNDGISDSTDPFFVENNDISEETKEDILDEDIDKLEEDAEEAIEDIDEPEEDIEEVIEDIDEPEADIDESDENIEESKEDIEESSENVGELGETETSVEETDTSQIPDLSESIMEAPEGELDESLYNAPSFGDSVPQSYVYWYVKSGELHLSGTEPTAPEYIPSSGSYQGLPPEYDRDNIMVLTIDNYIHPTDCTGWFDGLIVLYEIRNMQYLITDDVVSMKNMFKDCRSLWNGIDFSHFNTEKVIDMSNMFENFSLYLGYSVLDLSSFRTDSLQYIDNMFAGFNSLQELNIENFSFEYIPPDMSSFSFADTSINKLVINGSANNHLYEFNLTGPWYNTTEKIGCAGVFDGRTILDFNDDYWVAVGKKYTFVKSDWYNLNLKSNPSGQTGSITGTDVGAAYLVDDDIVLDNPGFDSTTHIFDGWQTEAGNSSKVYDEGQSVSGLGHFGDPVTQDINLYAHWKPGEYYIKFDGNGETSGTMATQTMTIGANIALNQKEFEKTGFAFLGWATLPNASTAEYIDKAEFCKADAIKNQTYTLYAVWERNTYTLEFNVGTVGATAPADKTKEYGVNATLENPTGIPYGYTFEGWYSDNALTSPYNGSTDLSSTQGDTKTLYAKWKVRITYNVNGHGTVSPLFDDVVLNGTVTLPTVAVVTGYTNDGKWYGESGCTTLVGNMGSTYTVTEPKTLYVKWNSLTYTLKFSVGIVGATAPADKTKMYGVSAVLQNPSNIPQGYTFAGWYSDSGLTTIYNGTTDLSTTQGDTKTLYAKWLVKITYNTNGYGTVTPSYNEVQLNGTVTLPTVSPVSPFTNDGKWYGESGCTTLVGNMGSTYTVTEPKTLYVKWNSLTYTLKFNAGTVGASAPEDMTKIYGINTGLPSPINIPEGYIFVGWYSDSALTTIYNGTTDLSTTQGDTKTLYAKWKARITYNVNGHGTVNPSFEEVVLNSVTTLPTVGLVTGYTNDGKWYGESGCTTLVGNMGSSYTVTEPKTLYVKWVAAVMYTVTFNLQGHGSTISPIDVVENNKVTKPEDPTDEGYTFIGWFKESGCINAWNFNTDLITDNTELFAKWQEKEFTVTYNLRNGEWVSGFTPITSRLYTVSITLPDASKIENHGFTFNGWSEDETGTSIVTVITANTAANKTLYAQWTLVSGAYAIHFDANGGTGTMPDQAIFNTETIPLNLNTFTRSGYSFVGWKDDGGTVYANGASIDGATLTGDITLYAQWEVNTPTPTPTPTPPGGGGSGGGSGGGGGVNITSFVNQLTNITNLFDNDDKLSNDNYYFEGPKTNNNIKLYENVTYMTNEDGTLSAVDEYGNFLEGFCRLKDPSGNENYYFFTEDNKLYCGYVRDVEGNYYHFNDLDGHLDGNDTNPIIASSYTFNLFIVEALKDKWVYDPVTGTWRFYRVTLDDRVGDICMNDIYEIKDGNTQKKYYFDKSGVLVIGQFDYYGQTVYTDKDGAIVGVIDSNGEYREGEIVPTAKLRKSLLTSQ